MHITMKKFQHTQYADYKLMSVTDKNGQNSVKSHTTLALVIFCRVESTFKKQVS